MTRNIEGGSQEEPKELSELAEGILHAVASAKILAGQVRGCQEADNIAADYSSGFAQPKEVIIALDEHKRK